MPTTTTSSVSTTTEAAGTTTGTSDHGSIELTDAVSGSFSIASATCPTSGTGVTVDLSGTVGTVPYAVTIDGPMGSFRFAAGTAQGTVPLVQLNDQSQGGAGKHWSAGFQDVRGSGSISVSAGGGSIDADLQPSPGTSGTVHAKGSWTCS